MKLLSFQEIRKILLDYKIPFCKSRLVNSQEEVIKTGINYPVVLKVFSLKGVHKSKKGGVVVNIKNEKELIKAWNDLSKVEKDGVLIQEMVFGKELIVGMKNDPQFGPVILFGLGGIFVEVLKDVSLRIAPVDKKEALEMIKETKAYGLLSGLKLDKLIEIIVSLSDLSLKEGLKEVDFNPVIINEKQVLIVDARFLMENE